MCDNRSRLESLKETLSSVQQFDLKLYFITRHLKSNVKHYAKVLDKYDFKLNKIDINSDVQDYFMKVLQNQLNFALNSPDLEMREYSVIGDDLSGTIYTYALNNALSFSKVITEQLSNPVSLHAISNLKEIKDELWAYCVKVTIADETILSFRKSSQGKVTTATPQDIMSKMSALFDSNDAELKLIKEDCINFDDKIDCIYLDNKFFVFKKGGFEQIVGLEEELQENAKSVIAVIEATNLVEGLDNLKDKLLESKTLLKSLSSIAKKDRQNQINEEEIRRMQEVLMHMEKRELKITNDGKIKLEEIGDIRDFVKLLNDFYKQGLVTGKYYGTNSGEIINIS